MSNLPMSEDVAGPLPLERIGSKQSENTTKYDYKKQVFQIYNLSLETESKRPC